MPDILLDFPIRATPAAIYAAVSSPAGLDAWWTLSASGDAHVGAEYELGFGDACAWRAIVTHCVADRVFALRMTAASADWIGTAVSFRIDAIDAVSWLRFAHSGWGAATEHYRVSSYCWAMYLRVLRRWLERGEVVPYAQRLDV